MKVAAFLTLAFAISRRKAFPWVVAFVLLVSLFSFGQNDKLRKKFVEDLNKNFAEKKLPNSARADGTTLMIYSADSEQLYNILATSPDFLDNLRKIGFTRFICTDDKDQRFGLDLAMQPSSASNATQNGPGGRWERTTTKDPMTDERGAIFAVDAVNGTARLSIVCRQGKLSEWQINTNMVLETHYSSQKARVYVRLDDGKQFSKLWEVSKNFQAVFGDKGTLMKIFSAKQALFEFEAWLGNGKVYRFDVADIDRAQLRADCGVP